jgi:hypothetical protein
MLDLLGDLRKSAQLCLLQGNMQLTQVQCK